MRDGPVLLTGASGLIGSALVRRLAEKNRPVIGIDLRADEPQFRFDVRDAERLSPFIASCSGIVHLAAVSRVVEAEREPDRCVAVNVEATRAILHAAKRSEQRPWIIFASSREVYGQQERLPVPEDAPLAPLNVYARAKRDGENLVAEAREAGLRTATIRFSNVYGSARDHADRVIPAFVTAALRGGTMRVEGAECTLDPTHVDDVSRGVVSVMDQLDAGEHALPPIHLVGGRGITLLSLAQLAHGVGSGKARVEMAAPRNFDVHKFVGDPERARALLGWNATTDLHDGLTRLARELMETSG